MSLIYFNFHGVIVSVDTSASDLLERLEHDFSHFILADAHTQPHYQIRASLSSIPLGRIPVGKRGLHTKNAVIFDKGSVRYNDYYGEAFSIYDFKHQTAEVFSLDLNRLHEITYLLILSRVGKHLDKKGLHRVHAMGISLHGTSCLCLMPMGGGKTTLFLHLLRDTQTEIISDDSPLVDRCGNVTSFPVRVGILPDSIGVFSKMQDVDMSHLYELDRMHYGKKLLMPIRAFNNSIYRGTDRRLILLRGIRTANRECSVRRVSFLRLLPVVFRDLVIGVGLPIMREYFIERNWRDSIALMSIFVSRLMAGISLTWKAQKYRIYLGTDHARNADAVRNLISKQASLS